MSSRGLLSQKLGIPYDPVESNAELSRYELLVIGKTALTTNAAAPDLRRVRDGLKVLVFEQSAAALEKRLGFRVVEYGLRQVFPRLAAHPLLDEISAAQWRDWRGDATLLPSRLRYTLRPRYGPTVEYCGLPVSQAWRCGNRGNVASVLLEKPARGDFLPLLDGGFAQQYSPLLEYHEGRGMVLFCQLDVTARSETEPVAELLTRRLVRYASSWKPAVRRTAVYAGEANGLKYLEASGVPVIPFAGLPPATNQLLIAGPGSMPSLAAEKKKLHEWLRAGGIMLALALDQEHADALLPLPVRLRPAEHIAASFEPFEAASTFAGIAPSELHNRDPRQLPLLNASPGVEILAQGVLGRAEGWPVVFCQLAPWQFDGQQANLKRTRRHTAVLLARLLGNLGVRADTPLLERFSQPVNNAGEKRWLDGLYLDPPGEWDNPYRFFRW
jgi:hypothetical protein